VREYGKNIVEWGRSQMTTWRRHFACWISKATGTHTHTYKYTHTNTNINTHTHNMECLLLVHSNNVYTNALNVTLYVRWLFCFTLFQSTRTAGRF